MEETHETLRPVYSEDGATIGLIPEQYINQFQPKLIGNVVRSATVFFRTDQNDDENYVVVVSYPEEAAVLIKVPRREITGVSIEAFSRKG